MRPNLTSPLNLRERLHIKPDSHVNGIAFASVLLVAAFLLMMTSKYIYSPGLTISFPKNDAENASARTTSAGDKLELPVSSTPLRGQRTSAVLTVKSDSMFIYDGRIYKRLSDAFPPNPDEQSRGILLVKIDKNASIQGLFNLKKAAAEAGFSAIQIAGEDAPENPEK